MKKILAVLMSIVMMFALVAMPVSAADEAADEAITEVTTEAADEVTLEEFISTVELTAELIKDTLVKVHYIVGTILAVLEKECPLCGVVHEPDFATNGTTDDEIVEDDLVIEDGTDAPAEIF